MADVKDDPTLKELEGAYKHADPTRGDKKVDGSDCTNISDVDEAAGVKTADKRF